MLNCLIMLTKRENSQKLYDRIFGVISRHTLRFVCAEFNFWPINVKKKMNLAVSFKGNAQGVFGNKPSNDQHNYTA